MSSKPAVVARLTALAYAFRTIIERNRKRVPSTPILRLSTCISHIWGPDWGPLRIRTHSDWLISSTFGPQFEPVSASLDWTKPSGGDGFASKLPSEAKGDAV